MIANLMSGRKKIALVLFFSIIAACTKVSPIVEHDEDQRLSLVAEKKVRTDTVGLFVTGNDKALNNLIENRDIYIDKILEYETVLNQKIQKLELKEHQGVNVLKEEEPGKELYELFLRYGEVVLNPVYINNSYYTEDYHFQDILSEFNKIIYLLIKGHSKLVSEEGILDKYWEGITFNCDSSLINIGVFSNCEDTVKLLKGGYNTFAILQFYAWGILDKLKGLDKAIQECTTNGLKCSAEDLGKYKTTLFDLTKKYYEVVYMVLATKNSSVDPLHVQAKVLYMMGGKYYVSYIHQLNMGPKEKEELIRRYVEQAGVFSKYLKSRLDDNPKYIEYAKLIIEEAKFWEYYSQDESINHVLAKVLLPIAFDRRVIDKDSMNRVASQSLSKGIIREIEGMSHLDKQIFSGLGFSSFKEEQYLALYIINQVYLGEWSADESAALFRDVVSFLNKDDFIKTLRDYIRYKVLDMIVRSSKFVSQGVLSLVKEQDNDIAKIGSERILFGIEDKSLELNVEWVKLLNRFDILKAFFNRHLKASDELSNKDLSGEIEVIFASIKENIKITVVYPLMMQLIYYVATEHGLEFKSGLSRDTIDTSRLVLRFIKGMRAWFDFGNDLEAVKQVENIYAMHFMLKTDIFSSMNKMKQEYKAQNGDSVNFGIFSEDMNEASLFIRLFKYSFFHEDKKLKRANHTIESLQNDSAYAISKHICVEEAKPVGVPREKYGQGRVISKALLDLKDSTFLDGHEGEREDLYKPIINLFGYASANTTDLIGKDLLSNRSKLLVFFDSMLEVLKSYWRSKESLEEDLKKREELVKKHKGYLKQIEAKMSEAKEFRVKVYENIISLYEDFKDCAYVFYKVHERQRYEIYDKEISRLLDIHEKLTKLSEHQAKKRSDFSEEELSDWKEEKENMEKDFTTEIQSQAYIQSKGDVKVYDRIELGASGTPVYKASKWDMLLRAANFLEEINKNIRITRPSVDEDSLIHEDLYRDGASGDNRRVILYRKDPEEFVKLAMRTMREHVRWQGSWQEKAMMIYFERKLSLMRNVYYLERLGIVSREPGKGKTLELEDIFQEIETILYSIHIDTSRPIGKNQYTEADFFRMLNVESKYELYRIKELFFRGSNSVPVYNYLYMDMQRLLNNNFTDGIFAGFAARAVHDIDLRDSQNTYKKLFFLPVENDPVKEAIINNYSTHINKGFSVMDDFISKVKELGAADASEGGFAPEGCFRYKIDVHSNTLSDDNCIITNDKSNGDEYIYLSQEKENSYNDSKREFHVETKCIFAASEEDKEHCKQSK